MDRPAFDSPPPSPDDTPDHAPANPARCEAVAGTMLGHFVTRLELEAKRAGGVLAADSLRGLLDRFLDRELPRFVPVFQRSFDGCTRAREAERWETARRKPFDRILIRRFAALFPPRPGDDGGSGILSRRMIPGFGQTIDKMVGPALYMQCQQKSLAIVRRLHAEGDPNRPLWDQVYDDPEAEALVNDVLMLVAHHFSRFEHRRAWFMMLVNSNLAPAEEGERDGAWQLTDSGFTALMQALFANLRAGLARDPAAARQRWGAPAVRTLTTFLARLDSAQ